MHPRQQMIVDTAKRFNTVKCGRRFGKTTLCEEVLLSPDDARNGALNGFPVAYCAPTYKMVMGVWREVKDVVQSITYSINEQEKRIELIGGGEINMWSLDAPNALRGNKYKRIIIDEAEIVPGLKDTWERVLRATLTDLKGDAWFLSTPAFGESYFKKLCKQALEHDDWMSWTFTTYDNPHLDPAEIDEAKAMLDESVFRCEFLAEDVSLAVNKFIYNFSREKHIAKGLEPIPHLPIILSFDFNVEPIVCLAGQVNGMEEVRILDEYRLLNSDIEELCTRIISDYPDRQLLVTGDASGQNRTAIKRDLNYYKVIQAMLNITIHQFTLPPANPPIKNTRVLCNSLLANHKKYLFSDRVPYLILDIEECEVDASGGIDKTKDKHKSHLLDAWRYFNWNFLKSFIDLRIYQDHGVDVNREQ